MGNSCVSKIPILKTFAKSDNKELKNEGDYAENGEKTSPGGNNADDSQFTTVVKPPETAKMGRQESRLDRQMSRQGSKLSRKESNRFEIQSNSAQPTPEKTPDKPPSAQPEKAPDKPPSAQPEKAADKPPSAQPEKAADKPPSAQPEKAADKPSSAQPEKAQDKPSSALPEKAPEKPPSPQPEKAADKPPSAQAEKAPDKPVHVKRVSSAGFVVDSVLKRKTGDLKEHYSLGRKLGHGQFGTTFLCVEKSTKKEFACKSIAKRKLVTMEDVEDVRREIEIMHHLKGNPNVITIKEAFEDSGAVHVVMDLCAGGELFDRIVSRGHYSEKKASELARVIVGVVDTCHSLGVIHRDLKPENFLFVDEEEESPLKTIDFGLSIFYKPGDIFHDVVGSPYYVAPEVLKKHYGPEADVWSAGIIIYILLSGVPPFWAESEDDIFEEVLHGELDFSADPWPDVSDEAKDLIRRMLERNPMERLKVHEVLTHPWIMADGSAPDKPLDPVVLSRLQQFSAMNKLKKMAFRVIADTLSEEEIAGLKEMFKVIDTDDSGQITFEELKEGLVTFGADLEESEISDLMKAADIDNSGTIDYGEFIAAMLHLNRLDSEDHMSKAFKFFDKDGSGYITNDELQQACKHFGIENIQVEDIIKEVDQNNDGRIDFNEFVAMMRRGNAELGKKRSVRY